MWAAVDNEFSDLPSSHQLGHSHAHDVCRCGESMVVQILFNPPSYLQGKLCTICVGDLNFVSASAPAFAAFLYFKLDEMNALSDEGISVDKS